MLPPFDRDLDRDRLRIGELSSSLRRFIERHGGSPMITAEVMRAINEIARLYHNARDRARSAERREKEASFDLQSLLAVTKAAHALLQALDSYQEVLGAQDCARVAHFAEALAIAASVLEERLGPIDPSGGCGLRTLRGHTPRGS